MKLEVGQKIGIYEVVNNDSGRTPSFPVGSNHLGETYSEYNGSDVKLFHKHCSGFYYEFSEVRLVASLRVKALK